MTNATELDRLRAENADLRRRVGALEAALATAHLHGGHPATGTPEPDRLAAVQACVASAPVGLALVDRAFRYVHINDALAELNGLPAAAHLGRTVPEVVPGVWPDMEPVFRRVLDAGEPVLGLEVTGASPWRPDRGARTCLANFFPVRGADGAVSGAGIAVLDITERKLAEEALDRYRLLSEHSRDIVLFVRPDDLAIVEANAAAAAAYGYARGELLNLTLRDLRAPDTLAAMPDQMARADAGGVLFETRHRRRDGATFPVEVSSRGADVGGRRLLLSVVRDITERRRAEAALARERERLALALRTGGLGVYEWDVRDGSLWWSPELYPLYGVDPGAFDPTPAGFDALVHPDDRAELWLKTDESLARGTPFAHEYRVVRPDGSVRWLLNQSAVVPGAGGRPERVTGVAADVTDRRAAAERLRLSEERFQLALAAVGAVVYDWHIPSDAIFRSGELSNLLGFDNGEPGVATNAWYRTRLHPDDAARACAVVDEAIAAGADRFEDEYRLRHKAGHYVWVRDCGLFMRDEGGRAVRCVGSVTDIGRRKAAEEAARAGDERFRAFADAAPAMLWVTEPDGSCSFLSRGWSDYTGQTPDQARGFGWIEAVHPDDRGRAADMFRAANARREPFELDYRLRRADGAYRWCLDAARPRFGPGDAFVGFVGSVIDIHERRLAEEGLAEAKRFNDQIIGLVPDVLYVREMATGHNVFANRRAADALGYSPGDIVGLGAEVLRTLLHPDDLARIPARNVDLYALGDGVVSEFEYRARHRYGGWRWFVSREAVFRRGPDGRVTHIIGAASDISGRKAAEEALRRSEERFRYATAAAGMFAWETDLQAGTVAWSDNASALLGCRADGLPAAAADALFFVHPDDAARMGRAFADHLGAGGGDYTWGFRGRDGRHWQVSGRVLRDAAGVPVRCVGVTQDVTARVRAEERLRRATAAGRIGLWNWDAGTGRTTWSDTMWELYGVGPAAGVEPEGAFQASLHPDDRGRVRAAIDGQLRDGPDQFRQEFRIVRPDGAVRWVESVADIARGPDGRATGMDGANIDVTDRKEAEDALRRERAMLSAVLDALPVAVGFADPVGRLVRLNRANREVWGGDAPMSADVGGYREWFGYWPDTGRRVEPTEWPLARAVLDGATTVAQRIDVDPFDGGPRRHLELSAAPVLGSDGERLGGVVACSDVTARVRAEAALRESEERFRLMADGLPFIIWVHDAGGRLRHVNRTYCEYFGVTPEEVLGESWQPLIHPDDVDEYVGSFLAAVRDRVPWRRECRVRAGAGWRWIESACRPFYGPGGEYLGMVGCSPDVTARKEAEERLRHSEGRLRLAMDAAGLGAWAFDPAAGGIEWDTRTRDLWGVGADEPIDYEVWMGTVHPDDRDRVRAAGERAMGPDGGGGYRDEYRVVRRTDGAVRWVESHAQVALVGGRAVRWIGTVQDVTDRREAEDRLRRSEEQFRELFASIDVGFVVVEVLFDGGGRATDYRFLAANPVFGKHTGLGDPVGRTARELVPGLEDVWAERYGQVAATGRDARFEQRSEVMGRCFDVYAARVGGPDSRRVAILFTDITQRKDAEERLRLSEERFRLTTEAVNGLLYDADPRAGTVWRSAALRGLLGFDPDEVPPTFEWWHDRIHPDELPGLVEVGRRRVAERCERYEGEYRVRHRAGHYIRVWEQGRAEYDAAGGTTRMLGFTIDVTRQRELEEQLRDADRKKDEFLATLAHELRNPLAPIQNGVEIIKMGAPDGGPVARALAVMDRQLAHLVHLIDDLLDVSRISRGKLHLRREVLPLARCVESAVEAVMPLIAKNRHELTVMPVPDVRVDGDPTRLSQIFSNLLTNAAKYTEPGGRVTVSAARDGGAVAVTVRDTGVGIPADMLAAVFEMFSQVDRALEKTTGGLGIGLSLVKGLVELHGGTVEARSAGPGQGSEFVVRLPVAPDPTPGEEQPMSDARASGGRRATVLVVDDNQDAAESLATMLEMCGHEVSTAFDGAAGVATAAARRPQVIFLDIGMPVLNGYDACRRIRAEGWGRDAVLIALTGWGGEDDRRKTQEAGFDHHLTKPVTGATLRKLLDNLLPAPAV